MTTLTPRSPYSKEELDRLYPKQLSLELVQIVSHHLAFHYSMALHPPEHSAFPSSKNNRMTYLAPLVKSGVHANRIIRFSGMVSARQPMLDLRMLVSRPTGHTAPPPNTYRPPS